MFMHGEMNAARPLEYLDIPDRTVTELNRRTRFHCDKEFIVRTETTEPQWFEQGTMPADAWELNEGRDLAPDTTTEPAQCCWQDQSF
jgi:hypothetical protein